LKINLSIFKRLEKAKALKKESPNKLDKAPDKAYPYNIKDFKFKTVDKRYIKGKYK
jgi:hypothetical protein